MNRCGAVIDRAGPRWVDIPKQGALRTPRSVSVAKDPAYEGAAARVWPNLQDASEEDFIYQTGLSMSFACPAGK